ncbi:MAG TPA: helix-turn-helix domain-containing protein [Blastocatellia bacterium]|nr:helix-turn-helix domain-containing protein [Blastocatellia bacterium]
MSEQSTPIAERDRLKTENNYLLARVIEMESKLDCTLDRLNTTLEQLLKSVIPTTLPQMLTVEQVAELYQVAERTVNGWVQERRIPFHRAGGAVRFRLDELLEWSGFSDDTAPSGVARLPRSERLQPGKEQKHGR